MKSTYLQRGEGGMCVSEHGLQPLPLLEGFRRLARLLGPPACRRLLPGHNEGERSFYRVCQTLVSNVNSEAQYAEDLPKV